MALPPSAFLRSPTLALLALCVVLPSVLLFILCLWLGAVPFLLDLDLLVIYTLIVWLARRRWKTLAAWGGAALVLLVSAVPILRALGLVYIADPALIPGYLPFWRLWPWAGFAGAFFLLCVAYLGLSLAVRAARPGRARVLPVLGVLLLVQFVDVAAGSSRFGPGLVSLGLNVSTSSAYQVFAISWQIANTPRFKALSPLPTSMMAQTLSNPAPRVLSVAVESWGWYRNAALNDRVLAAARRAGGEALRMKVELHDFVGGTLSGELRELCGLLSRGVPAASQLEALDGGCLPQRLKAMGYGTFAAHGNLASFYDRSNLYPALGFDELMFQPDFQREAFIRCRGSVFAGPCDRQVLDAAIRFLQSRNRAFAHVMTLDTHLPLKARDVTDRDCADIPGADDVTTCIYVHRFSDLLREITELVRQGAVDRAYVYGDHAPPYVDGRSRDAFLAGQVPLLILERVPSSGAVFR